MLASAYFSSKAPACYQAKDTKMKIVILDGRTTNPGDTAWDLIANLGDLTVYDKTPADKTLERAADADIIITNKTQLNEQTLRALPNLKMISILATGYNTVDVKVARELGIDVSNVPEYSTSSVAQHVFALMLELCLHIGDHDNAVHAGQWSQSEDFSFHLGNLIELEGKTLGIFGFGKIGARIAKIAAAFGMKVIATTRSEKPLPAIEGFEFVSLDELLSRSDFVSLNCPQTPETTDLVNKEFLAKMKPSAMLINCARGGVVVDQDLVDALNTGVIAGAGIDVASVEPLPADSCLLEADNLIITPHIAWAPLAARKRLVKTTADNVAAFIAGSSQNLVN